MDMLRFLCRFQADFWLISEWIEPFDWVEMLRFRHGKKAVEGSHLSSNPFQLVEQGVASCIIEKLSAHGR